uniref:Uncharacterized protein n=1 Tax=Lepeophtheirus salmonis TaxID=72036 RepID=A0A0K2UL51_LEPSM
MYGAFSTIPILNRLLDVLRSLMEMQTVSAALLALTSLQRRSAAFFDINKTDLFLFRLSFGWVMIKS